MSEGGGSTCPIAKNMVFNKQKTLSSGSPLQGFIVIPFSFYNAKFSGMSSMIINLFRSLPMSSKFFTFLF